MAKREAYKALYSQLALDYNARPEDFGSQGVVFTQAAKLPGRRDYTGRTPFFEMAALGHCTVIMADTRLHPALREWARGAEEPSWLLEFPWLLRLGEILSPYGYKLSQTHHGYLPKGELTAPAVPDGIALKWLEREDIARLYPNEDWPNALHSDDNPLRPDALALAAMDNGGIAGIAGASVDAPGMWQIGVDVKRERRGQGLGRLLVQGLAAEVQERGALPFYYSSVSNLHSQNIAVGCGFRPVWVDISAEKKES